MPTKHLLCPERLRRVPARFSWVDHRLVRDRHIEHCDAPALALYLFLVTVGDAQGLSYYADASVARRLSLEQASLVRARQGLIQAGLIAYEPPLYQVLALEGPPPSAIVGTRVHTAGPCSVAHRHKDRPPPVRDREQLRVHLRSLREVLEGRRHD
jgi:hypothetical protein